MILWLIPAIMVARIEVGRGFEAGIGIVILAIILDRITQNLGTKKKEVLEEILLSQAGFFVFSQLVL